MCVCVCVCKYLHTDDTYISLSHLDSDSAQVWNAFVATSPSVTLDCGWNWNCALIFLALPRCKCVAQFAATATVAQCHNLPHLWYAFPVSLSSWNCPWITREKNNMLLTLKTFALANLVSSQQRWYRSKSVIPTLIRLYWEYIILYHLKVQIS